MRDIKLSIPETGKAQGTCVWVADYISNLELQIINNGSFELQAREKTPHNGQVWVTIVKTRDNNGPELYQKIDDDIVGIWESENVEGRPSDSNIPTLFGCLTVSAMGYAWSFIKLCADELNGYIANDETLLVDFEIKRTE